MQQAREPLGTSRSFVRRVQIPAHFAEQQSIDSIAEGQDDPHGLHQRANQSLVDAGIQFHEQRS